ncbi:ABC transporter substrate-binding protein [Rossellomorea vietnamensis]|uniref:ABC transporter substrate-binding protein n=1 Tax=Rossellomorea vietnamensis TaxID=218284 RepID=A0A5D4NYS2_9BACI|nr:ABC transporter substrate-binding protein [Rossellomorea vietnamensis]TYS17822.1 ABC transporter substrate-binding protein [Rossellomorea vietnamensis]
MKKLLLLMLTLIFAAALAACGNNSEDASTEAETKEVEDATAGETAEGITTEITSPVEIEFWHAMSGDHEAALTEITDNFNESQENITVNLVNQGSYDDLSQKVMAAAKAKNLPAMSQAYEDWITEYMQNDLVADLTPYVNDAKYGMSGEELNDIVEIFRESNTWDGKYYGMPFNKSTRIMFYNTDYFEEAGLEAPTTWEELRAASEKLTVEKDGKKVVGLGLENSVTLEFNQWVEQAGGDFIDEESGEFKMNSPEGKEALEFVNGMIQDGVARTAGEDGYMSGPFTNGDVAIYIGSSAGIPYVAGPAAENGLNWSAAVLPAGKEAATPFAGTNVSVFNSASDEEKLAAWEFTKFLINTENTALWASKTGYLPVRYSALESDEWVQYKEENPVYGIGEQQFDAGFYDPRIVGAYGLKNAVAKELDKVLLGEMTVEEGLEAAEKAANAELGN